MRCENGHDVPEGASFCPTCGARVVASLDSQLDTEPAAESEPGPSRRRSRRVLWAVVTFVAVVLVAAAAVGSYFLREGEAKREAAEECRAALDPLLTALNDLHSRLAVGLTYQDYSSNVGDVSVVYGRLDASELDGECLAIGLAAERAFRLYAEAGDMWSNCIRSIRCRTDGPNFGPRLQSRWADAGDKLDEANDGLDTLEEEAGV